MPLRPDAAVPLHCRPHLCLDRLTRPELERMLREVDEPEGPGRGRRIRCLFCDHPITDEGAAISVAGSHTHDTVNPAGIPFHVGCFRAAPGCLRHGPLTGAHSWFAGYRWRYALCGGCGEHLGWEFVGPGRFFGLVLSRLRREQEE